MLPPPIFCDPAADYKVIDVLPAPPDSSSFVETPHHRRRGHAAGASALALRRHGAVARSPVGLAISWLGMGGTGSED
jgi:hypothetical protein